MEVHCLQAMKIVHHHVNGRFDWLIFGHQNVNPSREAISILSGKYKIFMFVYPVIRYKERENALIKNCKCGLFSLVFAIKLGEV